MLHVTAISFHRLPRIVGALAIVLLTLIASSVRAQTSNVIAWGYDQFGQLGDGYASYLPVKAVDLTGISQIAAGYYHTAALRQDGTVWT